MPKRAVPPAPTSADADVDDFYAALSELLRLYQFRDRERINTVGLTVTECYALEAIERLGAATVTGLGAELRLDKSTASRTADALERRGLVTRHDDPDNHRAWQLRLSPRGRDLHDAMVASVKAEHATILGRLNPAVRRAVTRVIRDLTEAARGRLAEKSERAE